jgi:hypothetical protein
VSRCCHRSDDTSLADEGVHKKSRDINDSEGKI